MNVLVTGGTGFVGREILRELVASGHRVRILSRGTWKSPGQSDNTVPGNVLDAASLPQAFAGVDAVIHLVGIISEVGEQTFEHVHVLGTQNVVSAAEQAGVKRFVHMSALGSRPNAVARYHQSKWAAEEIVRGSGLDWTIFRPSIIYGPGDGFVNLFARIIRRSPIVPIMGNGESKFQPVTVESVAIAFVKALAEPPAVRQTFDLCGAEVFTLNEIVDAILTVMQRQRLKLHVPLAAARFQAALLEFIYPKVLGKAAPLNRDQLHMLQEDNTGETRAATDLFGLDHPPFRQRIARYLCPSS
jgi:NADH dehydrogenase